MLLIFLWLFVRNPRKIKCIIVLDYISPTKSRYARDCTRITANRNKEGAAHKAHKKKKNMKKSLPPTFGRLSRSHYHIIYIWKSAVFIAAVVLLRAHEFENPEGWNLNIVMVFVERVRKLHYKYYKYVCSCKRYNNTITSLILLHSTIIVL